MLFGTEELLKVLITTIEYRSSFRVIDMLGWTAILNIQLILFAGHIIYIISVKTDRCYLDLKQSASGNLLASSLMACNV